MQAPNAESSRIPCPPKLVQYRTSPLTRSASTARVLVSEISTSCSRRQHAYKRSLAWLVPWVACWYSALPVHSSLQAPFVPTHGIACSHSSTTTRARRPRKLCSPSWHRLLPKRPGWQHPWSGCISMTALSRGVMHPCYWTTAAA